MTTEDVAFCHRIAAAARASGLRLRREPVGPLVRFVWKTPRGIEHPAVPAETAPKAFYEACRQIAAR